MRGAVHVTQLNQRMRDMAEARYLRRMKREHQGASPFDPRKVPAFKGRNLQENPDVDSKGRVIWCGLDAAELLLGDGVSDVTPSCFSVQVHSRISLPPPLSLSSLHPSTTERACSRLTRSDLI